jgi:hypothetical protein
MCASKIGRTLGVGEGVGVGDGVGLANGEATGTLVVGDGELAAGGAHPASNTKARTSPRAITL